MNKYRFIATINGVPEELFPTGTNKLSLDWKKDSKENYYDKSLNGTLVFTGADFQKLYAIENSVDRCQAIPLVIDKRCGDTWKELYTGKLIMNNGNWWIDGCQLQIKVTPAGERICITKNKSKEYNLLMVPGTRKTIRPVVGSIVVVDYTGGSGSAVWGGAGTPDEGRWQIVAHEHTPGGSATTSWAREEVEVNCTDPQPGAGWILVADSCGSTGKKKYARNVIRYNYVREYEEGVKDNFYYSVIGGNELVEFDNGVSLEKLLLHIMDDICPGLTVVSDFFQINPENGSTINYVTELPSKVLNLILYQKSDIVRFDASQNATIAKVELDDILEALRVMFNVRWDIIDNVLRIEHLSWWPQEDGLDLTTPRYAKYVKGKLKYSYEKEKMPQSEIFTFKEAKGADFKGVPITYDGDCVNTDEGSNKAEYKTELITDVQMCLLQNPDENLDGLVIIAAQEINGILTPIYEPGILGAAMLNNSLGWAQLHRDYHRHGRVLYEGRMNNQLQQFESIVKTRKGATITVEFCCDDVFNPYDLIRTALGKGEVSSAKLSLMTDTLELELTYEADLKPGANQPPVAVDDEFTVVYDTLTPLAIFDNDTDPDNNLDYASLVITQHPAHGAVNSNGALGANYVPDAGYIGTDLFKYRISDAYGLQSNEATVRITVPEPAIPPVANDDEYTGGQDQVLVVPQRFGVLINDSNYAGANTFSVSAFEAVGSAGGALVMNHNGSFTYTPPVGYAGQEIFTYTIANNKGATDTAQLKINVLTPAQMPFVSIVETNSQTSGVNTPDLKTLYKTCNVEIRVYADAARTIPKVVPGLIVNWRKSQTDLEWHSDNSYTDFQDMVNGSGLVAKVNTEKENRNWNINSVETAYWYRYFHEVLPGTGYKL